MAKPPPLLPDWEAAQLYEGCAVEADSYARHLQVQDSHWGVRLATVKLPNGFMHSIAVVERDGETYIRDSVLGVFAAGKDVQVSFDQRLRRWRNEHPQTSPNSGSNHQPPETEAATKAAIEIVDRCLWTRTRRYLVIDGETRFWAIAWTTVDGKRALYHPKIGTTLTDAEGSRDVVALKILHALGCENPTLIGSSQR